ncbi:MAG: hypothetical protein ACJARO_001617, partial [Bacteriovoracaceae bacterium]
MKNLLLGLGLLTSMSAFALGQDFDVNLEKKNLRSISKSAECKSFLTRLSWLSENSDSKPRIVEMMSTIRLFKDNVASSVCPVQEFNAGYLILKMDELIGYDSHPGVELKSFSEIR